MEKRAKLVEFEGIDGSGKSTQCELLANYLRKKGQKVKIFRFPRHGQAVFGQLVDAYLNNHFGPATKLDPFAAAFFFAADRWEARDEIMKARQRNDWVLLDRYVFSNWSYQGVKIKNVKERKRFEKWAMELEFDKMRLPRPDRVLYFKVPFAFSSKLMDVSDALERDSAYLLRVKKRYDSIAKSQKEWQIIEGTKGAKMLDREQILAQIKAAIHE